MYWEFIDKLNLSSSKSHIDIHLNLWCGRHWDTKRALHKNRCAAYPAQVWLVELCSQASNYLKSNIPSTTGQSGGTIAGSDCEAAMPDQHTESFSNYHFKVWQVTCKLWLILLKSSVAQEEACLEGFGRKKNGWLALLISQNLSCFGLSSRSKLALKAEKNTC